MSDGIEIDASGFDRYAGDLAAAAGAVAAELPKVVGRGALNVKNEWNAALAASPHFKAAAGSVNYDTRTGAGWVEAMVGPDKDRYPGLPGPPKKRPAAALASIAIFGGANGGGGSVEDPQNFLDREAPRFESALNALIREALS